MDTFKIYIEHLREGSQGQISKDLAEKLAIQLEKDFCDKTGLELDRKLFFFLLAFEANQVSEGLYILKGDLIGPDSVGVDAEAVWGHSPLGELTAHWTMLDIDHFSQYDKNKPMKIPIPETKFPVTWIFAWESHLPDLYFEIAFKQTSNEPLIETIKNFIERSNEGYSSVTMPSEKSVNIHVAISDIQNTNSFLTGFVLLLNQLHGSNRIGSLQIGPS
jgi:hypothetical protein